MKYRVSRRVDAAPERVWSALLDVGHWPDWDTGVAKVEGGPAVDGARLKVFSDVSPGRSIPVRVALDDDRRVMRWTGGMPLGPMSKWMPDLQPSLEKFADGIKTHCERG